MTRIHVTTTMPPAGPGSRRAVPLLLDNEQRERLRWLLVDPDLWVLRTEWETFLATGDRRTLVSTDDLDEQLPAGYSGEHFDTDVTCSGGRGAYGNAIYVRSSYDEIGYDLKAGDLFVFRGRRGDLIKVLWHDGIGLSLYAKRLERGRFLWPSPADGVVAITPAQLGYLLEGIDWRNPQRTWRPLKAG
jgi:transposase